MSKILCMFRLYNLYIYFGIIHICVTSFMNDPFAEKLSCRLQFWPKCTKTFFDSSLKNSLTKCVLSSAYKNGYNYFFLSILVSTLWVCFSICDLFSFCLCFYLQRKKGFERTHKIEIELIPGFVLIYLDR